MVAPRSRGPAAPRRVAGAVLAGLALVLTGCSADEPPERAGDPAPTSGAPPPEPSAPSTGQPPTGEQPTADGEAATRAPPAEPGLRPVGAYAVSAGHPDAVAAGMQALADGGSAVDAAVAAALAVSVVEPFASGVGGGGAALVHPLGEQPLAYDYREVVAVDGRVPASGTGVPGLVAGLERLHEEHGVLPWTDLVQPAVELAEDGVPTTSLLAGQLVTGAARLSTADLPQLYPGGAPLQQGDPLVQPELADTLRSVAEDGAAAVHDDALDGVLTGVDGIDAQTLEAYEVATPAPVVGALGPFTVVGAGLPLTGVTLVQTLQMAAALGATDDPPGSAGFVDALTTAWRTAEQDLLTEVGDPAYVAVPVDRLTDPAANAAAVDGRPLDAASAGSPRPGDGNTTHVTVVDGEGTVVSMTNTLTSFWGSGQEVGGFFLNDQLRRFELGTGRANAPEPGKRSVSYSSPTIVTDQEGRPVLGIGSPGGARIVGVLSQVILGWGFHEQSLQEAVDGPRTHLEGGVLYTEPLPAGSAEGLRERGYAVQEGEPVPLYFGSVQGLEVDYDAGQVRGAQDARRAGTFAVRETTRR
jgi:gamma-glutamyltranspeptidase / glutathione hydrolase